MSLNEPVQEFGRTTRSGDDLWTGIKLNDSWVFSLCLRNDARGLYRPTDCMEADLLTTHRQF
jgi:hypothetical protein